jgi:hypothetical protein
MNSDTIEKNIQTAVKVAKEAVKSAEISNKKFDYLLKENERKFLIKSFILIYLGKILLTM